MAFLGDLARQRSLASAALLLLMLVDEIEGLAFVALGVVAHRPDLFVAAQDVLFPASVCVAMAVSLARNWRRRRATAPVVELEPVALDVLAQRIGAL